MGEVKQKSKGFNQKHFDEALRLAKKIKPNILLFASFDGKESQLIFKNIKRLKKELEPLKIEVVWYKLREIHIQY